MLFGVRSGFVTALLGVGIAFIAKDLAMPLIGVAVLGLFDRLIGVPMLRERK
jgi:hypothetical protein